MKTMNILYDHQIFDSQKIGGISRYFYELMRNNNNDNICLPLYYTNNIYLSQDERYSNLKKEIFSFDTFLPKLNFKGKHKLYNIYKKLNHISEINNIDYSIQKIIEGDFDIFHPTYYDTYFLDKLDHKPFVLTIHDMIHEKYPEFFLSCGGDITYNKKILAQKATRIIAISEHTKKDIIELYHIPEDKISVVYHGSTLDHYTTEDAVSLQLKSVINKKYILFTGTRKNYKNFYFFIRSVSELLSQDKDLHVVCTANDFDEYETRLFSEIGISNQLIHVFASDKDLFELYRHAQLFVFPSYYEGFGIPILEAYEAECPVVLANASCFPEIAQDAALYFDPKNQNQLVDCCKQILNNSALRNDLISKGIKRFSDFSWKKTTEDEVHDNPYTKIALSQ